jgi:hypothetical protein
LWRVIADRAEAPGADSWAQAVCVASVAVLSSVDAAAVTLRAGPRAQELLGASDAWVADLGELQYTLGEGPGVEAFFTGGPVLVLDLGAEQARWPGFGEAALGAGVGTIFAFPLQMGAIRLGTLELFRRQIGGLPASEVADAALLAGLATAALLRDAESAGRSATRPVTSYQDVNIATGMLAAQLRISLDDAFVRLRAHAYTDNRSLQQVARDVLERRLSLDELAD